MNLENQKVYFICNFIEYYAHIELNDRLKKFDKYYEGHEQRDIFIIEDYVMNAWKSINFISQDFLNELPNQYYDTYMKYRDDDSDDDSQTNDYILFIQNNIKSIIEYVIKEKKVVNYAEEVIKINEFNKCNYTAFSKMLKKIVSCGRNCIGNKCLIHEKEEPICYI